MPPSCTDRPAQLSAITVPVNVQKLLYPSIAVKLAITGAAAAIVSVAVDLVLGFASVLGVAMVLVHSRVSSISRTRLARGNLARFGFCRSRELAPNILHLQ